MATTFFGTKAGSLRKVENWSDGKKTWRYDVTFLVLGSVSTDQQNTILETFGIPAIGAPWPGGDGIDEGALCVSRDVAEQDDGQFYFEVACVFDSEADKDTAKEQKKTPEKRTPIWNWGGEVVEELLESDPLTDAEIVNSVGEPIFTTVDRPIPLLTVKRFERSFSPQTILDYVAHVNSKTFYGAPSKTVLMLPIVDEPAEVDGIKGRDVTYQMKFNLKQRKDGTFDGWRFRPLDHGTFYLDGSGNRVKFEVEGQPRTGNLSSDGTQNTGDAEYLTFNKYPTVDFNKLKLGPFS